jgi:hypothetical protein
LRNGVAVSGHGRHLPVETPESNFSREWYLARLASYRERFGFRLQPYCLMDNHVYLAVETGKAPMSRIIACLQSSAFESVPSD